MWTTAYLDFNMSHAKMEEAQSCTFATQSESAKPMDDTISTCDPEEQQGWVPPPDQCRNPMCSPHWRFHISTSNTQISHNFRGDPGDISKGWASASPLEAGLIPDSWHFRINTNKQAFQVWTIIQEWSWSRGDLILFNTLHPPILSWAESQQDIQPLPPSMATLTTLYPRCEELHEPFEEWRKQPTAAGRKRGWSPELEAANSGAHGRRSSHVHYVMTSHEFAEPVWKLSKTVKYHTPGSALPCHLHAHHHCWGSPSRAEKPFLILQSYRLAMTHAAVSRAPKNASDRLCNSW